MVWNSYLFQNFPQFVVIHTVKAFGIVNKVETEIYAEYIMQNPRLDETQAEIKIAGSNINNLRYADDTTFMAESEEKLKNLFLKVKEKSVKAGLKTQHSENEDHGIWSHHFMSNRWGNNETVRDFFWAPQTLQMVTAAMKLKDTCSLDGKLWQT